MAHVLAKKLGLLQCSCHPHLKFPILQLPPSFVSCIPAVYIFAVTPVFRVLYTSGIHFRSYPRLLCLVYRWYTFSQLPPSYTSCIPVVYFFCSYPRPTQNVYRAVYILQLPLNYAKSLEFSEDQIFTPIIFLCLNSIYIRFYNKLL